VIVTISVSDQSAVVHLITEQLRDVTIAKLSSQNFSQVVRFELLCMIFR